MCELYIRANNVGLVTKPALVVPLSQVILADALGLTPVHLNRTLKQLRLAGAMTLQRNALVIADPIKLAVIAGFDETYLHRRLRQAA